MWHCVLLGSEETSGHSVFFLFHSQWLPFYTVPFTVPSAEEIELLLDPLIERVLLRGLVRIDKKVKMISSAFSILPG